MAWPDDVFPNGIIDHAWTNTVKNSVRAWPGAVDAQGNSLTALGFLGVGISFAGGSTLATLFNASATTGTWQAIQVGRATGQSVVIAYVPDTTTPGNAFFAFNHYGDAAANSLVLRKGGNVGIGTTAPTSPLQVVGLPTYASDAAAGTGGLTAGALYKHSDGSVFVKL